MRNTKAMQFMDFLASINKPLETGKIQGATYFVLQEQTFQVIALFSKEMDAVTIFSVQYGTEVQKSKRTKILEKLNELNLKYTKLKFVISVENLVQGMIFLDTSLFFDPKEVLAMMLVTSQTLKDEWDEISKLLHH
ncbi:MAG: hypothetical protein WCL54_07900 [Clostridia bacterium]